LVIRVCVCVPISRGKNAAVGSQREKTIVYVANTLPSAVIASQYFHSV